MGFVKGFCVPIGTKGSCTHFSQKEGGVESTALMVIKQIKELKENYFIKKLKILKKLFIFITNKIFLFHELWKKKN